MPRRRLTPEDEWLWRRVTDEAKALPGRRRPGPVPSHPVTLPEKLARPAPKSAPAPAPAPQPAGQIDRKIRRRMTQGKLKPEGRLDLHGMTLDRAHPALSRFILASQGAGKRMVLVITGKARAEPQHDPSRAPRGILNRQVPQWLALPPLARAVIEVVPAHVSHGGDGAYYVYLRRAR